MPPSRFRNAVSFCRSIFLMVPLIYLYTIVMGSCSLLCSFFDHEGRYQHGCARIWARLILKTILSPVHVSGAEHVVPGKPMVYAANHSSALDIPLLYANLPTQFRILAKEELFRYPFLGWHLRRSGQVAIERSSRTNKVRSVRKAVDTLRQGMPIMIFPEGGRSRTGQIRPFQSGAFYLAIKAQAEIVPVVIVGASQVLPMNTGHVHPQPINLFIGEPIPTEGLTLNDIETLNERVQHSMEDIFYAHSPVEDPRETSPVSSPPS